MKTLRAVNLIHITVKPGKAGDPERGIAPVRPEVKSIAPGTRFKAPSEATESELLKNGSAVLVSEEATVETQVADPTDPPEGDIAHMKKAELIAFAAAAEPPIEINKSDKVDEIRAAIAAELEAREAGAGDDDDDGNDDDLI